MFHRTVLSRVAALALLAAPALALADSGQPCPCAQGCATHSQAKKSDRSDAQPAPQGISAEAQQAIWTAP